MGRDDWLHVNEPNYMPGRVATVREFAEIYERDVAPPFKHSSAKAVQSISRIDVTPTISHYRVDEGGVKHIFYESPGADHEWQTWQRDLKDFAPRLFQPTTTSR